MIKNPLPALLLLVLAGFAARAAEPGPKAEAMDPWTAQMTPSAAHTFLQKLSGGWQVESTVWMPDGTASPVFKIAAQVSSVLGGRYLQMKYTGEMGGMPFEGLDFIGFDNITAEFTRISLHNFGTGALMLKGRWTKPDSRIELTGALVEPMNKTTVHLRQAITFVSADEFILESFDRTDTGEHKSQQMRFTRVRG